MNRTLMPALLGSLVWTAFGQESSKNVNFYSVAHEIQLGQAASAELERTLPMLREPGLDAYVAQLGSALARRADPRFVYSFAFYDDRQPVAAQAPKLAMPIDAFNGEPEEAVAVAGGRILVPLSLLARGPNEAVFAFRLAHSIAHIALRHSTRLATRAQLATMAIVQMAQNAPFHGQPTGLPEGPIARQLELQADKEATRIMAEAGFDPQAAIRYLEGAPPDAQGSAALSVRPTSAQREEAIRSVLGSLPSRTYSAGNPSEFAAAKVLASRAR